MKIWSAHLNPSVPCVNPGARASVVAGAAAAAGATIVGAIAGATCVATDEGAPKSAGCHHWIAGGDQVRQTAKGTVRMLGMLVLSEPEGLLNNWVKLTVLKSWQDGLGITGIIKNAQAAPSAHSDTPSQQVLWCHRCLIGWTPHSVAAQSVRYSAVCPVRESLAISSHSHLSVKSTDRCYTDGQLTVHCCPPRSHTRHRPC
jgi:hypothetical protein